MKAASEEQPDAGRRSQAWRTALWLGLMVLAVFVAWLAAGIVRSHLVSSRARDRGAVVLPGPTSQPRWVPKDPAEALSEPYAAVGLARLDADPGQIPPPAGARMVYAFQRRRTDQTEQQAHYEFPGTAEEVVGHYTAVFEARGFRLLKNAPDATGRRTLVFDRPPVYAVVSLRTDLKHAKLVIVVLTVVSPTSSREKQ